jgi:hypothetical protein
MTREGRLLVWRRKGVGVVEMPPTVETVGEGAGGAGLGRNRLL